VTLPAPSISRRPTPRTEEPLAPAPVASRRTIDWVIWTVAALVLVALVLHLIDLGVRAMHHDESLHATFSWYLTDGRGYRHNPLMHGPFQFHLIALLFKLFGDGDAMSRVPAAVAGAALVATPLLLRRWLGSVGVIATSVFLVVSPSLLYYSRFARNDIFVAVWTVLLIAAVWRYRDDGRLRWLVVLGAALSLSFTTKETAYLTAALLLLYLSVVLAISLATTHLAATPATEVGTTTETTEAGEHTEDAVPRGARRRLRFFAWVFLLLPVAWLIAAAWPLLGSFRRRLGWLDRPREADLMVVFGTLTASQMAAAIQIPLERLGVSVTDDTELIVGAITVTVLVLGGAAVGAAWDWRRWAIVAGLFYAIYLPLFTTGFTNPDGFGSAFWGSLDYWLDQQDVNRGNQPVFYYFMMVPLYEMLTLVPAFFGGLWLLWRRDGLAALMVAWFVFTLIALTIAGEKMPWLTVHLALPLAFLAGYVAQRILPRWGAALWDRRAGVVAWAAAGAAASTFLLVFALTVQTGLAVSFDHPDTPIEPLIYTQTAPEVPILARRIEAAALSDPSGVQRQIYVDTSASLTWPWAWYLRHLEVTYAPQETFTGDELPEGAILVTTLNTIPPTDPLRFEYQEPVRYHHRWWFPESGYRRTSPRFLFDGIRDGSLPADWWSFVLNHVDESQIGSLEGEVWFPE